MTKNIFLLLLIAGIYQNTYSENKNENSYEKFQTEFTDTQGFAEINENNDDSNFEISGGLGPQFIYEQKKEQWGKNKSYQFSPIVGIIGIPKYDFSTSLEVKRSINKWTSLNGDESINKSWEFQLEPRYYLGYYLGAPVDIVGEIKTLNEKRPKNGKYNETEYSLGFAQRRSNLYSQIRYSHLYTHTDDKWNNQKTQGDGFDVTLKPFVVKGSYQFETEFYYKLQQRWDVPDTWGQTYTEFNITPGIIKDFGNGRKLSLRTEIGWKKETKKNFDYEAKTFYWKATLGYDFMITENLAGLIELEYEKDKMKGTSRPSEKTTIKKVTAGLNYKF